MTVELNYIAMGRRVKTRRIALRLTQEALAEKAGISLSFVGHIERGSRKASIETLLLLARALDTTPDELLIDSMPWASSRCGEMETAFLTQIQDLIEKHLQDDAEPESSPAQKKRRL